MIVLGIETSCDETALCLLEVNFDASGKPLEYKVLGSLIHSQISVHQEFGGVFPALAKREHSKNLLPLLEKLFLESKIHTIPTTKNQTQMNEILKKILEPKEHDLHASLENSKILQTAPTIDLIAVTEGPGLEPALWVGINFAKVLGEIWNIPVIPVNHMEGHVVGSYLQDHSPSTFTPFRPFLHPVLALLVSGGHTELILSKTHQEYSILGKTRDDAVGEAFDKVARMLGLRYPGGPEVSRLAAEGRAQNIPRIVELPRPMLHSNDLDFSFSGLKTAVLYYLRDTLGNIPNEEIPKETLLALCREFEDAVIEVLIKKTEKAIEAHAPALLIAGGGVVANKSLKIALEKLANTYSIPLYLPTEHVSGDNALMIACVGALRWNASHTPHRKDTPLTASGTQSIDSL